MFNYTLFASHPRNSGKAESFFGIEVHASSYLVTIYETNFVKWLMCNVTGEVGSLIVSKLSLNYVDITNDRFCLIIYSQRTSPAVPSILGREADRNH